MEYLAGDDSGTTEERWPFVRTVVLYEVIDSTSDRAAMLLRLGAGELPLLVWSRRQTRGRGRGTHEWWSDAGSLTFTLAIDATAHGVTAECEPALALVMAVAAIEALNDLGLGDPALGIRWPNDLEVDGRKLGGILPERVEVGQQHRVLLGVGLNITTSLADAPEEVCVMATSLAALHGGSLAGIAFPRVIATILERFAAAVHRLAAGDPGLAAEWNRLDLLRDRPLRVDLGPRIVAGRARGIDAQGALYLDDGREEIRLLGGQVLRN